jgi:putative membrane protein
MWGAHDGMGWWMMLGGLWMLFFWGLVVWLVVWGAGRLAGRGRHDENSPLEIARRRYAEGQITKEQFDQLRRDLG